MTQELLNPDLQIKAREIYKKYLKGGNPRDLADEWNLSVKTVCEYIKWAAEEIDTRFDPKLYRHQLDTSIGDNLNKLEDLYKAATKINDKIHILAEIRKTKELKGKIHAVLGAGDGKGGNQPINIYLPNLKRGEGTDAVVVETGGKKEKIEYDSGE